MGYPRGVRSDQGRAWYSRGIGTTVLDKGYWLRILGYGLKPLQLRYRVRGTGSELVRLRLRLR